MDQYGRTVLGDYSCVAGNAICRGMDNNGTISGNSNGNAFRAATLSPENSRCYFTGQVMISQIIGTYECSSQAGVVDIGEWKVKRADELSSR